MNRVQSVLRRWWRDVGGMALSGVLLWVTLSKSSEGIPDLRLTGNQYVMILLSMGTFVLTTAVQAWRMTLFPATGWSDAKKYVAFSSLTLGNFYNALLPGNLGELVKSRHFSKINGFPFRTALVCWISEKFSAGIALAIISATALCFGDFSESPLRMLFWIPIVGALMAALILGTSILFQQQFRSLFKLAQNRWLAMNTYRMFHEFKWRMLSAHGRWRLLGFAIGTIGMTVLNVVNYAINLHVCQVPLVLITPSAIAVLIVLMAVVYFVPSAPSSAGVIHFGIYSALEMLAALEGIEMTPQLQDTFVFTSVVFHLSYFVPETLLGVVYVIRERRRLF